MHRFITCRDKQQQKQLISTGKPALKKVNVARSDNKSMATVCFWGRRGRDVRGIIDIDYFEKGRIINGEYHANLSGWIKDDFKKN